VVDDIGNNIGVMTRDQALELAAQKGLDLVEISPTANPPVAKIISFDKFRYQQEKEFKKHAQKPTGGFKQIRISVRAAENDFKIKVKKLEEFLEEGDKVEVMMVLRGREKYNQEWARKKFAEFLKLITAEHQITMPIKPGGKGLVMQIQKTKQ